MWKSSSRTDLVEIGQVVKPHGLRGHVIVELVTDREEERLASGSSLDGERHGDREPLVVARATCQRPASQRRRSRWIVQFEGKTSVEEAEALRGAVLLAEPLEDGDALWTHDLVGAEVVLAGTGERAGTCTAVLANPAADLLELDTGALVPVVFVVEHVPGRIVIDPPEGLLDL